MKTQLKTYHARQSTNDYTSLLLHIMKKQFTTTTNYGKKIWYLDTKDRSAEILSGSIYPTDLCWHRTDGPAYIGVNGSQQWWVNGERHRIDGPAVIWLDGSQFWYLNGSQHRTDGPAIICADGRLEYYVNDRRKIKNKSFQKAAKLTDEEMMIMIIKYGNVK